MHGPIWGCAPRGEGVCSPLCTSAPEKHRGLGGGEEGGDISDPGLTPSNSVHAFTGSAEHVGRD